MRLLVEVAPKIAPCMLELIPPIALLLSHASTTAVLVAWTATMPLMGARALTLPRRLAALAVTTALTRQTSNRVPAIRLSEFAILLALLLSSIVPLPLVARLIPQLIRRTVVLVVALAQLWPTLNLERRVSMVSVISNAPLVSRTATAIPITAVKSMLALMRRTVVHATPLALRSLVLTLPLSLAPVGPVR